MLERERMPGPEVLAALPIFPLPNALLLPGMVLPLNVFEPRYLALVDHALEHGKHVGVPLLKPGYEEDYDGSPAIEPVMGIGHLMSHSALPDGRRFIRLEGIGRVRVDHELALRAPYREVAAEPLPEDPVEDLVSFEILKAQIERIARSFSDDDGEMVRCVMRIPDPRVMLYALTAIVPNIDVTSGSEPSRSMGRARQLELQQRCLDEENSDDRVMLLLDHCSSICDELGESGRFPAMMRN